MDRYDLHIQQSLQARFPPAFSSQAFVPPGSLPRTASELIELLIWFLSGLDLMLTQLLQNDRKVGSAGGAARKVLADPFC